MPTLARISATSCLRGQQVLAVQHDLAFGALVRVQLVHAVEGAQQVDLPQPEGPMKAVTLFSGISRLMFFSAWNLP